MAQDIPFSRAMDFEYGTCDRLSPLVRRVSADNPGPFTFTGTGTDIIGEGKVAVIDPGPMLDAHLEAILAALDGETVSHILITHTHHDHSPLAAPLKERTGAMTYGYGPHGSGRPAEGPKIEEGGDFDFVPDVAVGHGDMIEGDGWTMECVYTPGHTSNHMCFALKEEKVLFTGDHVMGWSTSVIGPPDGNMADYMASLRMLLERDDEVYWPTHGPAIRDPKPFINAFIDHREGREREILARLEAGDSQIKKMVPVIYAGVEQRLYPAAGLSVLAHMEHLVERELVTCDGPPRLDSDYRLA